MNVRLRTWALAALMATAGLSSHAATFDLNLAGFKSYGDFGDPQNSFALLSIAPGSTVTGWEFLNLRFETSNGSYLEEFVISVNDSTLSAYMDAAPSDIADEGVFGPASGSFATAAGGNDGGPFLAANGSLYVTVWELFDDPGLDATVTQGTLRIQYTPAVAVPEPSTYAMLALGMLGIGAVVRRRREI